MFIGIPDGDGFLFGEFWKKLYNLRLEMKKEEGITLFEPSFMENKRKNYHLNKFNLKKRYYSLIQRNLWIFNSKFYLL